MTYDIIIIGAGAAGLTAAIYARRARKSVLCLEVATYGGQIINTERIENYPAKPHMSGTEFANEAYAQAEALGAEFEFERVVSVEVDGDEKVVKTEDGEYRGRAVIIATGSTERHLGLSGEEELIGHGVSYCATCDGNFFKDQDVAVDGGGNTAMWDALYLADICRSVTIIHRRDEFRADEHLVEMARKKANVHFEMGAEVTKLLSEDGSLSGVELSGAGGDARKLTVKGLFVAIGRVPATEPFAGLVDLDEGGYIIAGEDCQTKTPGVFVAGDTRTKTLHQLVTATADGAVAATAAVEYLNS